ncbi:MAG: response regulator, partial [Desulfobacterales bacterium]
MNQSGPTVCIVDDDRSVCMALGRLVESAGFKVKTYGSAQKFLDEDQTKDPDLLILDVRMPGMTGLELQNHLAASGRAIPIVFITAHENGMAETTAMAAGAVAFFQKPFDERDLLGTIYKAL